MPIEDLKPAAQEQRKPMSGDLSLPADQLLERTPGSKIVHFKKKQPIFSQDGPADFVFLVKAGKVKLSITSTSGKEATLAFLNPGDFAGEDALNHDGGGSRIHTATAFTDCTLIKVPKKEMRQALQNGILSAVFIAFLLGRNAQIQAALNDRLFHSTEKRLARVLLTLADHSNRPGEEAEIARVSQEALASMIGTTRSRVNMLMNRFRKKGFIRYNGALYNGALKVNSALLKSVLQD